MEVKFIIIIIIFVTRIIVCTRIVLYFSSYPSRLRSKIKLNEIVSGW